MGNTNLHQIAKLLPGYVGETGEWLHGILELYRIFPNCCVVPKKTVESHNPLRDIFGGKHFFLKKKVSTLVATSIFWMVT